MLLQIERVDQVAEPAVKANYTIYEFMCSGWIKGEYVGQIKVQTLSGKEADFVQPGWAGEVEEDTKFGIHYKIPTPAAGQDGQGKAQGLQPVRSSQQPQKDAPTPTPSQPQKDAPPAQGKVKFVDLMNGYTTCLQAAKHIAKQAGREEPICIEDAHAIASTLFIQAQRGGVHIPAPREAKSDAPKQPPVTPPPPPPPQPAPEPIPEPTPEPSTAEDDPSENLPF